MSELIRRYEENPVLEPAPGSWDCLSVFNPGAIAVGEEVWMLYRAVTDIRRYISRFGLAISRDGRRFERAAAGPVLAPMAEHEMGGIEDARITRDGDGFLITYAAVSVEPGPAYYQSDFFNIVRQDPYCPRPGIPPMGPSYTGLLRSRDLREFSFEALVTPPGIDDRDGVLFPEKIGGRYAMLHRPTAWTGPRYGCSRPSIWIAYSDDLKNWDYGEGDDGLLMQPENAWEEAKIGAGPPPVKTEAGWLLIYHGVDNSHVYRVGAALLDARDPRRVLARTGEFLMQPREQWEKYGIIPNVVFPTAVVLRPDGELLIYYGGADRVIGLALSRVDDLLDHLIG